MDILDTIIKYKKTEVQARKLLAGRRTLEAFFLYSQPTLSLKQFLLDPSRTGIIAEFKRMSPSKGVINDEANVYEVTKAYARNGASALSVLTDTLFFGGSFRDLSNARSNKIPVLQKDFIIDEYQITEAKASGADAILLIAACLTVEEVRQFAIFAKNIGLEVLLELHEEEELEHICDETEIVGINNRNLKNFSVDLEHSFRMAEKIPAGKIKIAESGLNSVETIRLFKEKGFNGFLIGEYFMRHYDPGKAFAEFVQELKNED